jgi:hypothetical protein
MTNLEQNVFEMLFGCLLGDAHVGVQGKDKVYITFEQSGGSPPRLCNAYL